MLETRKKSMGVFRGRRLRSTPAIRNLVRESHVGADRLIQPVFVHGGQGREGISSMPGIARLPLPALNQEAQELADARVGGVMLFGIPSHKDANGSGAFDANGIVQRAIRTIRAAAPDILVIADVCLCEYTNHGHCGILKGSSVDNDATLPLLARTAVSLAEAGAQVVAPSAMMDGQVAAIRQGLDESGHVDVPILSYAAKYASAFYGPFREAAGSTPKIGDRRGYQMDSRNAREALREIEADIREGADFVLVKPALPCLDILRAARERFDVPIGAYQVSGEYAMVKAAAKNGWLDEGRTVDETLTAIRRAGADFILSYFAKQFASQKQNGAP